MRCNYCVQLILLITAAVCLSQCAKINLYEHPNFGGKRVVINLKGDKCLNLMDVNMDKRAASIDSNGNCVYLHAESDCKGNHLRIAPGTPCHYDLGDCGNYFYRKARSAILC